MKGAFWTNVIRNSCLECALERDAGAHRKEGLPIHDASAGPADTHVESPHVRAGDGARLQMDTGPIAGQRERAAQPLVAVGDAHTERRPRQTRVRRGEGGPTRAFLGGRHRHLGNIAAYANLRQEQRHFQRAPRQRAPDLEISEGRAHPRGRRCHRHAVLGASERQDDGRSSRMAQHARLCRRHNFQEGGHKRVVHLHGHVWKRSYLWPIVTRTIGQTTVFDYVTENITHLKRDVVLNREDW